MQNELPEWAKTMAFDTQSAAIKECQDNRLFVIAEYPFVTGAAKEVLDKHLARALVAAERRGIERAAKECDRIAGNRADFNQDYRRCAGHCSFVIRQLGREP